MTQLRPLEPAFQDSFDAALRRMFAPLALEADAAPVKMSIDVSEKPDSYDVKADIPGVRKEDIHVRIDGNIVQIDAERRQDKETRDDAGKVLRSERYSGSVSRSFSLAQDIDDARAQARYADGVLTLALPKKATTAARKVTVE